MTPPPLKQRPALPPTLITMFAEVRNCAVEAAILALSPSVGSWKAAVCTPLTVKRAAGCVRHETPGGGSGAITATSDDVRGHSEIAVIAPLPPPGVSCLTQPGALLTVSGAMTTISEWPRT